MVDRVPGLLTMACVSTGADHSLSIGPTLADRSRTLRAVSRVGAVPAGATCVYFDVEEAPEAIVTIRAVGVKARERVLIGGEEVDFT